MSDYDDTIRWPRSLTPEELLRLGMTHGIAATSATGRDDLLAALDTLVAERRQALDEREKFYEKLCGIANADTKYPSMPSGFTGDWKALRDEARSVLSESEDGIWE